MDHALNRTNDDRGTRITRSWHDNAAAWTDAVRTHALESRRLVTDGAILDAVLGVPGSRVLDVGCGEGWLARELAASDRDVVGFDGSSELIGRASADRDGVFVVLDYAEFITAPWRVGCDFDAAVCNFSILAEDIEPLLRAIRHITRPRGRLVIQTVHPFSGASDGRYEDGWREEKFEGLPGAWTPMPWYYRTVGSWVGALRSAGWRLQDCREPIHPATGHPASLILIGEAWG